MDNVPQNANEAVRFPKYQGKFGFTLKKTFLICLESGEGEKFCAEWY